MTASITETLTRVLGLVTLWATLAGAASPLPFTPPSPDLTRLVPFVSAPLAKPPTASTYVPRPRLPLDVEPIPPATLVLPVAPWPIAPLSPSRALACAAAWLPIASEALTCGRARFQKGEYDAALKALEEASHADDGDVAREARYWLAETYVRLRRLDQARVLFRQVAQEARRAEQGPWALDGAGWTSLALGDHESARQAFADLLAAPVPAPLDPWARHGLGLSLYALRRYAEAAQTWATLRQRAVPATLARDVAFWYGDTLGHVGQPAAAASELAAFTKGGAHPLLGSGTLRQAWWDLSARHFAQSAVAFREYLAAEAPSAAPGPTAGTVPLRAVGSQSARPEHEWAEAGLTLAVLGADDWAAVPGAAAALETGRSDLVVPVLLRVVQAAVVTQHGAEAQRIIQHMLEGTVSAPVRAWLLFEKGEAFDAEGNRDEARTQYELARDADPASETGRAAAYLVAATDFELREFPQAVRGLAALLGSTPRVDDLRAAALLLHGEAAYQASDLARAEASFRRFLTEFPDHERVAAVKLALAWTALRQQRSDEALRKFLEFARTYPDDPRAVDALQLASELTLAAGDLARGRQLVDDLVARYGTSPRSDIARLNRAVLLLREGQAGASLPALREWIARAASSPLVGRAHAALGTALLAMSSPREAAREFVRADAEGAGTFAVLGRGVAALEEQKWDEARRCFTEVRDNGRPEVAAVAEYGLAAVKVHDGALREFKPFAQAALDAAPAAPTAPRLLYVLAGIAIDEEDWPGALASARRLVAEFPSHEAADDGLQRVGESAAAAQAWPVAYEAFTLLRSAYPSSPFAQGSVGFAEAQINTGHAAAALSTLGRVVAASPSDARAWLMLARTREATGDRQGALEGYARAAQESRGSQRSQARLGHARLLLGDDRIEQARDVLHALLDSEDTGIVLEAADMIGDTYAKDGDHLAAAEYYMTAAYLEPGSALGRRGLLGAGRSFAVLNQTSAAATVYGKLLAQPDVPADVAEAVRQGVAALPK